MSDDAGASCSGQSGPRRLSVASCCASRSELTERPGLSLLIWNRFRYRDTDTTTATVSGQSAQVTYAGPQEEAGLDQVNVLLPRSLAGSGDALVVLSVNGSIANAVHVTIQ